MDINSIDWSMVLGVLIAVWGLALLTLKENNESVVAWVWALVTFVLGVLVIAESVVN